ncbi:hypothetical protein IVB69_04495 [Flavobacterium sp. J49]|uniref:hypothetical protein n=1 Tax=Flavobacterium sp. J49 TaxID=2718534 RepID=UPI001594DFB1|nr:hypothetical protein [Flavobacterium sp. J49]MBF6640726.1 hypothetical protein [Flavobacterium sp. J49]NIC01973.1 hypothetical protein [Flavobacterium sp. J49]
MTTAVKIDLLNIVLIFLSLFVSLIIPFELFLFSYAVLGPLHYMTEINWLHQKDYFVRDKRYIWILLGFTVSITVISLLKYLKIETFFSGYLFSYSKWLINLLIVSSLFFSIGLILFKETKKIIVSLIAAIVLGGLFLKFIPFSFVMVGVFLPTLIHVYLFTMLFMVFGVLKTPSIYGVAAIIMLVFVPFFIFYNPFVFPWQISESVKIIFLESRFKNVIVSFNQLWNEIPISEFNFNSGLILKIQSFIAFAYTYHYLNWFSKTSIIGWNKNLSKPKFLLILILWIASIALYTYSYKVGIIALFFLSMFHVIVEFPLNIVSIKAIFFKK